MNITKILVVDLETYYDAECSLKRLNPIEYINHPKFHFLLGSIYDLTEGREYEAVGAINFHALWSRVTRDHTCLIVSHNIAFDGVVLAGMKLPLHKHQFACTMSMMQAAGWAYIGGASLDNLAKLLKLRGVDVPDKGTEVHNMMGVTHDNLVHTPERLARYQKYCLDDTIICARGFIELSKVVGQDLMWQSLVHKALLTPQLRLDHAELHTEVDRIEALRAGTLSRVAAHLKMTPDEAGLAIRSSEQFAKILRDHGVEPPMKTSPTTGKQIYAFSKTDPEMMELVEDGPSEEVQMLCAERLASKSVGALTRARRFQTMARLTGGSLPVPLKISGAHTHRLSGMWSLNMQNLPTGRAFGQTDALRHAIKPKKEKIVAADAKQIELRLLAYVANCSVSLNELSRGLDPYIAMGAAIWGIPYEDALAMVKSTDSKIAEEGKRLRQSGKAARLGLGFRAGPGGYINYCTKILRMPMDAATAERHVSIYRSTYPAISKLWRTCDQVISFLSGPAPMPTVFGGPTQAMFTVGREDIGGASVPYVELPTKMRLHYPALRYTIVDTWTEYEYAPRLRRGDDGTYRPYGTAKMHGGVMTENLIQALGAQYLSHVATSVYHADPTLALRPALVCHDELVYPVDAQAIPRVTDLLTRSFRTPPDWLVGCPLDVDIEIGDNYAFR